jgi:hypothetical protein
LTATVSPARVTARWTWPMLAAALPAGKKLPGVGPEVLAHDLYRRLGRERGRLLLQAYEHALQLLLVSRRSEPINVRGHLPKLQRQALHLSQGLEHRLGRLLRVLDEPPSRLSFVVLAPAPTDGPANGFGGDGNRPRRERAEASQASETRNWRRIHASRRRHRQVVGERLGGRRRPSLRGRRRHGHIMRTLVRDDHWLVLQIGGLSRPVEPTVVLRARAHPGRIRARSGAKLPGINGIFGSAAPHIERGACQARYRRVLAGRRRGA